MSEHFVSGPQFTALRRGQNTIDLEQLMFEIAADAYRDLDVAEHCQEFDRLGDVASQAVSHARASGGDIKQQLRALSRVLYDEEGFHGNEDDYYDPRNSYLNEVLSRRCGIPISLGIVYIGVARRAGLTVFGVPTPGRFVLGALASEGAVLPEATLSSEVADSSESKVSTEKVWYIDPFCGGDVLPFSACKYRVERNLGQPGVLSEKDFRPAADIEIVVRVLRNLKAAQLRRDQWQMAIPIQERLLSLLPDVADEQRDLGLIYLRAGLANESLPMLNRYVEQASSEKRQALEPYLRSARRMAAELN